MIPSARIADFIRGFEKCRLVSFLPTPRDKPTIGWGATGPDIHLGMSWTPADCAARFASDLAKFGAGVSEKITSNTTQNQYDALVSFAYNLGLGALGGSTLLQLHNKGLYALAAEQFGVWIHQGEAVLPGLVKRRAAEQAIYEEKP